jgi:ketosteroid isomerase-like protein
MPTNADTRIDLPAPIAAYFAADATDATDATGVASCFTENGLVVDEHHEHHGRHAIARWKIEATAKYHYTSEPLLVDVSAPDVTVFARITGEFPGSPIDLRYRFTLEGDKIARLEITA